MPHLKLKTNTLHLKAERERVSAKSRDNTSSKAKCPDTRWVRRQYLAGKRAVDSVLCLRFMRHLADNKNENGMGLGIMEGYCRGAIISSSSSISCTWNNVAHVSVSLYPSGILSFLYICHCPSEVFATCRSVLLAAVALMKSQRRD